MRTEGFSLVLVVLIGIIDVLNGQKTCLASNNQRWKTKRGKCVDCPPCPSGKARNLTEQYVGFSVPEGDTQCLPCRECPKGFYAGDYTCQPCRKQCDEDYHRHYDEICEGSHDARCGSCLIGYEDTYRNIQFACTPKQKPATESKTDVVVDEQHGEPVNKSTILDADVALKVHGPDTIEENNSNTIIIVEVLGTTFAAIVLGMIGLVVYCKRRRQRPGLIGQDQDGENNDLQIDGGRSQYSSQSEVRGELPSQQPLLPHPELSRPSNTVTPLNGNVVPYTVTYVYEHQKEPRDCQCPCDPECHCYMVGIPNIEIKKSDEYIMMVSTNICHNERQLYVELKLSDAEIHAKEDDRKMDPKEVTLQEKVLSLLNRWVEIGPAETVTIHTLMKALCKSRFHKINEKIIEKLTADGVTVHEIDIGGR